MKTLEAPGLAYSEIVKQTLKVVTVYRQKNWSGPNIKMTAKHLLNVRD